MGPRASLEILDLWVPIQASHGEDGAAVGHQGQQLGRRLSAEKTG